MNPLKNKNLASLILFALFPALSACATLSKKECLREDWRQIGFRDGRNGYSQDRWDGHVKACQRYGSRFDKKAYFESRERGLKRYCTPENGFRVGKNGESYQDVCPSGVEPLFLKQYKLGLEIRRIQQSIASLESEVNRLEGKLQNEELNSKERRRTRISIRSKDGQIRKLRLQKERLEEIGSL